MKKLLTLLLATLGVGALAQNLPSTSWSRDKVLRATSTADFVAKTGLTNVVTVSNNYVLPNPIVGNGSGITNIQSSNVVGLVNGSINGAGMSNVFGFPNYSGTTNFQPILASGFGSVYDGKYSYNAGLSTNDWIVYTNSGADRWLTFNVYRIFTGIYSNAWHISRQTFPDIASDTGVLAIRNYPAMTFSDGFGYNWKTLGGVSTNVSSGKLYQTQTNSLTANTLSAETAIYTPNLIATQITGVGIIKLDSYGVTKHGIVLPSQYDNGTGTTGTNSRRSTIQWGGDINWQTGDFTTGDYNHGTAPQAAIFVDPNHGGAASSDHPELEIICQDNVMFGIGGILKARSVGQIGTAGAHHGYWFFPADGNPGQPDSTCVSNQTEYCSSPPLAWMGNWRATTNSATQLNFAGIRGETLDTNGTYELAFYNPLTPKQSQSTNGNSGLNPWGLGTNFGTRQMRITSTNVIIPSLLASNLTVPGTMTVGTVVATSVSGGGILTNGQSSINFDAGKITSDGAGNWHVGSSGSGDLYVGGIAHLGNTTIDGASGINTLIAGTRTFIHDGAHTLITNTATLTSTEWKGGQEIHNYNGNVTTTLDKTNGIITARGFDSYTNSWTSNTPFALGTNAFITSGAVTMGVTGVGNISTSTSRYGELTVKATGDIIFTNSSGIFTSDAVNSRTITNGNVAEIAIKVLPGLTTNMAFVQFKQQ